MRRWFSKKVHISWIIAWTSAGILAGIGLAAAKWQIDFTSYGWLIISCSLLFLSIVKPKRTMLLTALCAGMMFGFWRGSLEKDALANYKSYYGHSVVLKGKVTEDTSYGSKGDQRFRLGDVQAGQQELSGEIWISMADNSDIKRGDIVTLSGPVSEGFGNLQATVYRAKAIAIERPSPGDIGRRTRDWFAEGVRTSIPEPQASLGVGFLVGQRSTLPEELDSQLKTVSLTHIVVASGYNLTILVAFACRLLAKKSKYLATLSGGAMIIGFILMTGLSPSMSRAGLVSGLGLLAWYYGRKIHPLVLLPFAAAITVVLNPAYLWGDVGWYLSFSAFAGILILAPLLNHYFWVVSKRAPPMRLLLIETISAQIVTLPIIILIFGKYSLYALPANLLVLPFVPLAMLLTFVAGTVSLVLPVTASIVGLPATALLTYMTSVVDWLAKSPGSQSEASLSVILLILCYLVLILGSVFLQQQTKHNFRKSSL